jgi:hypothetical protein
MNVTVGVTDNPAPSATRRSGRRRAVVAAIVAALLACALAASITMYLDRRYGPIEPGSFGGVYSEQNLVPSPDDSSYRLAASTGASAELLESLTNTGAHQVEVTAIDTDDVVTDIRWSELRTVPGGYLSGISTPWQKFPARIPAHTTIRLLGTIHRPTYCSQIEAGSTDSYGGFHRVHWKSLLRRHVTTVEDQVREVHVC